MEPGVDPAMIGGIVGGVVALCLIVLLIGFLVVRRNRSDAGGQSAPSSEAPSLGAANATEASVGKYASTSDFRQGVAHSQIIYDELPTLDS